jgi:RNA polymerase sigma-70 factor (ECF subfamily)
MSDSDSTCWTVVHAAASGSPTHRDELARRYIGVVRAYLEARWRASPLRQEADDAAQEVFLECFRTGGLLEATASGRVPSFRAFLYGAARNVARRFETRPSRPTVPLPEVEANEEGLSRAFERAWARAIMVEAAEIQKSRAAERGAEAARRVELLRLRFEEGLPIRAIAERWGEDAAGLHHAYAQARKEFREALLAVVAFHHPGSAAEVEREASGLLQSLSG